jgi:hypothetical protein
MLQGELLAHFTLLYFTLSNLFVLLGALVYSVGSFASSAG